MVCVVPWRGADTFLLRGGRAEGGEFAGSLVKYVVNIKQLI